MCDVCKTVEGKLNDYLDQLIEEHPGEEVRGHKVPRDYHMAVALTAAAVKRLPTVAKALLFEKLGMDLLFEVTKDEPTTESRPTMFGGPKEPFAA